MSRPGDPANRPDSIQRVLPRTSAIREDESFLSRTAAVVQVTGNLPVTNMRQINRLLASRFQVPREDLNVVVFSKGGYLVTCTSRSLRDMMVAASPFAVEDIDLSVLPWSRRVQAELVKWCFSIRVCFEGIPSHAWSAETVTGLLDEGCLIQDLDEPRTENETACLCAWLWADDPDSIPKEVHFELEEPLSPRSPDSRWDLDGEARQRTSPPKLLAYPVLVHLDQVLDFNPPPTEPTWMNSLGSQASGIISPVSMTEEIPKHHDFIWSLGVKDGTLPPQPPAFPSPGPGRDRSRSRSRSPPARERRRPLGWDVPPARSSAFPRRSSSRSSENRGGSYGGGHRRAACSPVRAARSRSPRGRSSPPPSLSVPAVMKDGGFQLSRPPSTSPQDPITQATPLQANQFVMEADPMLEELVADQASQSAVLV
nr:hypothetical protein [Oryza sativa Japonica Group]BAD19244.1 hypothetical protein [Oryza sativa Japonica Group]